MRSIWPSFVVAPPTGAKVRTRPRLSTTDEEVLLQVGEYLGSLAGGDLALWVPAGASPGRTEGSQAGAHPSVQQPLGRRHHPHHQRPVDPGLPQPAGRAHEPAAGHRRLEQRVQAPVGSKAGRVRGYATPGERWAKQRRLQTLSARLARVEARLVVGRVSVVRGGRRLLRLRHQLKAAELTESQWRQRWAAERLFLTADGEADKAWGNETIRWHPIQGWLELKLPTPLAHLANRPHGRRPGRRWRGALRHHPEPRPAALVSRRQLEGPAQPCSERRAGRRRWGGGGGPLRRPPGLLDHRPARQPGRSTGDHPA
jgi:hypothetical protein